MPRMPQVRAHELVRFLKSQGFIEDRQSGPLDPLAITLLEVEPSIWRHSAVRLERLLARRRVLLSKCESLENRTHPY